MPNKVSFRPTEVTSKRPVSRKRVVVDVPKIVSTSIPMQVKHSTEAYFQVPRDPRFLQTAGEFDPSKFQKSYGFLADNHKAELQTLRETLKLARKKLASSPKERRSEREHEVYRLEQAVKRAESTVNRDRLQKVEREALGQVKKEEQEKRKQGKGEWFMKKSRSHSMRVYALLNYFGSRQATVGDESPVRSTRERRWSACGEKGNRKETEKSEPEGKTVEAVCKRRGWNWPEARGRCSGGFWMAQ